MNPRPARTASSATHVARLALRRIRRARALILCATSATLLLSAAAAHALNPTPAQLFYVPFPEDQLLQGLQAIDAGNSSADPTNPVTTYISIAAVADGTIIYYDQWENGYDADIANPANLYSSPGNTGGTQIWGDGNPANGAPPGIGSDLIDAGTVIILNNNVTTTNLSAIDFDGRDKIAATKTVAVSHTAWANGSNTLLAGSVEVFDTNNWGTDYRSPVGANIPDADDHQMFEYSALAIQAGEGGATVQIDKDANGSFETTTTLAEGESYFVNGGVNVGGHVVSDKPVQVDILTGDIGSNYESRDSGLLPTNLWSTSSYTPVSTASSAQSIAGTGTTVWLYNPSSSSIIVSYTTRNGSGNLTTTSLTVPGGTNGGYLSQVIPDGYGAHFETVSAPFYAFSTTNSTDSSTGGNQAWDWGFTLIPEDALTPQVLIGLGIGRDPTSGTNPNEDGNPVWVTPVGNGDTAVTVYVDYDADPSTGPFTDPNGSKYDTSVSLKELERAKIYDPNDDNQTGLLAYVLTAGVKLAAAWGQDPLTATASAPGLDVGTGVPPLPLFSVGKNGTLSVDADGDGFVSPGDTILYTIAVNNISRAPVPDLRLTDNIPAGTAYVPGTTTLKIGAGPVNAIPDDFSGTPFPLDGTGRILDSSTALPVGGSYEVTFKVTINSFANLPSGTSAILNVCTATSLGITQTCRDNTPIYGRIGDFVWLDIDGDGVQDGGSETGIGGVTINLYVDLNGNGIIDGADSIVATQTTNGSGGYLFTGVPAGTYVVDVATTNPSLANLTLTTANDPKAVNLAGGEWRLDVDFGYRNLCVQTNGSPVVCSNGNECADPGTCQPSTGLCSAAVPKANGTACTSDNNACTVDTCQAGACTHTAGNTGAVCRAANGACDVAETCNGSSTTCPADGFLSSATVCRGSAGACDVAETCPGNSGACPADTLATSGTVCRASAGVCDVAETCNGSSAACPTDGFAANTTVCRAATDVCDVAEQCTGSAAACPTDGVKSAGTQCRASAGVCDVVEACNGTAKSCPTDGFASSGTVCRSSAGVCDVAEQCTGSSAACPTDGFAPSSTVCRSATGVCDLAETCTGSAAACPADGVKSAGTQCRASGGVCDVVESCDGSGKDCPVDGFAPSSTVCRSANGVCDVAEQCTGSSAACPTDGFAPSSTVCRTASGECDLAEQCTGSSGACPADTSKPNGTACTDDGNVCTTDSCQAGSCSHPAGNAGTECRAANGVCDVAEACTGSSTNCPGDGVKPNGTECRASAGVCDVAEACNGSGKTCPTDGFSPSSTVCRSANGACDVAEQCTGSSATCPTDGFAANTTVCRPANGACDVAEKCTGTGTTCPTDGFAASGVLCRAANGVCDVAETCSGTSGACPTDGVKAGGTICRAASGTCDVAETCDGTTTACPTDGFATSGTVCRAANGACDVAETCSGTGGACPTDGVKPGGTVCRASAGVCDVAESCNGTSAACPNDGFVAAGTQCRAANGQCDVAEACTGSSATCPTDGLKPNGSSCADGDLCTQTDTCQGGSCVGSNPVQCTALDQCHTPGTCEPSTGQCSNPTVPDGTQCSDGDMCSAGDQCVGGICTGVTTLCELCHDLEDNDNDGLIDCLDPDCPTCPPIIDTCNHPCVTSILFQRTGLDLLRLQASFKPFTPIDPATEQVGLLITNANGVVFADLLAPGAVKRVGKTWVVTVKNAKKAGGIFKMRMLLLSDGSYRVNFKAYGAMKSKITLPQMSVQILVGDDVSISTQTWETIKTGWRVQLQ